MREESLRVKTNGGFREVAIEVIPLKGRETKEGGFLILFEDADCNRSHHTADAPAVSHAEREGDTVNLDNARLTQELFDTRDYLQSLIEHQEAVNETGIRAMQSTPLYSRGGTKVGMISMHWRAPHTPTNGELRQFDILARQAADLIERKRAEDALREADRRKNEFLAMLAHELRNPLAPIGNAIDVLRQSDGNEKTMKQATDIMQRQMRQMIRLIDDLLDVSRITEGKIHLRKERLELASVVNHAVEAARPLWASKEHELKVTLSPQPIYVDGDPARLAQVVGNLLNNACRYTENGGRIELTVERQSNDVVISVKDNGIGIAGEQLTRIFDMFTQVDTSLERAQSGLGIGLALVERLYRCTTARWKPTAPLCYGIRALEP